MPLDREVQSKPEQPPEEFSITLRGSVEKIITTSKGSVVAQITIEEADELYREIRVSNIFHDRDGKSVQIEEGTEVQIAINVRGRQKSPSTFSRGI